MTVSPRPAAESAARSLADDIRGRSDEQLADLLRRRQDLARPAPADLSSLAARASTRASVQRAIDTLDLAHLQALEAATVLDGPVAPTPVADLLGCEPSEVQPLLDDLWAMGLLWASGQELRTVRTVGEVLPHPAGLGPSATELRLRLPERERWSALVDEAPQAARAILDRLTWGPAAAVLPAGTPDKAAEGARWLLEHHLVGTAGEQVVLPREVALALRGGRLHREPALRPPRLEGPQRDVASIDAAAGQEVTDLLALVDELAADWGLRPPRVLRAGGLAVRDLARLATTLDVDRVRAAFVAEVAYAAGLVADDGALEPSWAPTPAYDDWAQQPAAQRWASLASAWLTSTRAAHLVGTTPAGGGTVNALGPEAHWPAVRGLRRDVLDLLASAPTGQAVPAADLTRAISWHRPRRTPRSLDEVVESVLQEAQWVGVGGRGALSSAGAVLLTSADETASAAAIRAHLPEPIAHILLQADLTAIAPGPVEGSLATFLRLVAEIESRGGATVYRFSPQSIRRALDAGWSVDQVLSGLQDASHTPIPQPLEYLVRDVARRHGQARVGAARAYIRCDDEATLGAMVAERALSALQLRAIAPTVLVSPVAAETVLEFLRDNGFAPAAETPDGGVIVPAAGRHRTPQQRRADPVRSHRVDDEHAAALVVSLRAGEATSAYRREELARRPGPALPSTDPTTTLAVLRDAAAERQAVWVGYSDAGGRVERLLFYPERVEGGRVHGTSDGTVRTLSIHRVTGAAPG